MKPVPRLSEDPALATELRSALRSSWKNAHDYDVAQGLSTLRRALGDQTPSIKPAGRAQSRAGASQGSRHIGRWLEVVPWPAKLAVLSAAATVVFSTTQIATRPTREAPSLPVHAAPAQPDTTTVTSQSDADRDDAAKRIPSEQRLEATAKSAGLAPSPADEAEGTRREIEQLLTIRALLPRDPEAALRLAQQSAREFPHGALEEERDALQILARARLGDPKAARMASAFLRRHPESGMRAKLEQLIRR